MKLLDKVHSITYGEGFLCGVKTDKTGKKVQRLIVSFTNHTKTFLKDGRLNYFSKKDLFRSKEDMNKALEERKEEVK